MRQKKASLCAHCGFHAYVMRYRFSAKYEKHAQDGVVTNLEDETDAGSADAKRPLKGNVLCLKSQIIRRKLVWGVTTRRASRILSFDFSKRPAIASLYKETNYC